MNTKVIDDTKNEYDKLSIREKIEIKERELKEKKHEGEELIKAAKDLIAVLKKDAPFNFDAQNNLFLIKKVAPLCEVKVDYIITQIHDKEQRNDLIRSIEAIIKYKELTENTQVEQSKMYMREIVLPINKLTSEVEALKNELTKEQKEEKRHKDLYSECEELIEEIGRFSMGDADKFMNEHLKALGERLKNADYSGLTKLKEDLLITHIKLTQESSIVLDAIKKLESKKGMFRIGVETKIKNIKEQMMALPIEQRFKVMTSETGLEVRKALATHRISFWKTFDNKTGSIIDKNAAKSYTDATKKIVPPETLKISNELEESNDEHDNDNTDQEDNNLNK